MTSEQTSDHPAEGRKKRERRYVIKSAPSTKRLQNERAMEYFAYFGTVVKTYPEERDYATPTLQEPQSDLASFDRPATKSSQQSNRSLLDWLLKHPFKFSRKAYLVRFLTET